MSDLTISLLGPVRADRGEGDLPLGGRRQKAVLVRLAIVAGEVVPADRLIDDLWGDEPPASAANTVQSYVSNLRRVLGTGDGGPPVIERVGDGYRLATDHVALASVRFEQLVAGAAGPGAASLPRAHRIAALEQASGLWHGQAIADFADEPWARGVAVRLDELRIAADEERFDLLLAGGQHAVAVGQVSAALEAHPLRERLAAQLVLALYRCGRQSEALRAYERTRSLLADELGLEPGPALARLADQVLNHDPALELAADETGAGADEFAGEPDGISDIGVESTSNRPRGPGLGAPGSAWMPGSLPLPPAVVERRARTAFVGRAGELERLHATWQAVAEGDRRLVAVTGEPGMGKTRLAQVFAHLVFDRQAHEQGGQVLWGRSTAEDLIAYQPIVEALRTALRSAGPDAVAEVRAAHPALGALLPQDGAGSIGPDAPDRSTRAERYDLYEAVAGLLGDLGADHPVLVVLDDAQWADQATLGLLDHLLHREQTGRVLFLLTIRRPAGRATAELDRLLTDVRRDDRFTAVDLAGIGDDEVAAIVSAAGHEIPAELATDLCRRTGGNPFFVESLAERGGDALQLDPRQLPESVRDLIDQRVAALPPETARVLVAAAVGGLRGDLALLADVAELGPDELLDEVDAAVAAGLLTEDEELGWVAFPHALVRQALVARTTRNREAQLHLRFADAIERQPGAAARTPEIADHLVRAGRLCPPERAATAAIAAGRRALEVSAEDEALAWVERAIAALDARAEDTPPDQGWELRAEARLVEAEAARRHGQRDRAVTALAPVIDAARAHDDTDLLVRAAQERALVNAGVGFHFGVVDQDLIDLLDDALARIGSDRTAERAALLAWSSISRNALPGGERQGELADEALALAETLPERPDVVALALLAQRFARSEPGGLEDRLELGPRMHEAATAAGWVDLTALGMVLTCADLLEAARTDEARAAIDRLGTYIEPYRRPGFDAFHRFLLAALAHMDGHHEEAEARSAEGAERGLAAHAENAAHARGGMQTMLARDLGTAAELAPLTEAMVGLFPDMPAWRSTHAMACIAAGDAEAARAACDQVFEQGLVDVRDTLWATMITQLAEACWLVGSAEQCATVARAIEPDGDKVAVTGMGVIVLGPLDRPLGLALAGAGHLDGAIAALTRAIDRAEAAGIGLWAARARRERALVAEQRAAPGDAELAAADHEQATAWATAHGVHLEPGPIAHRPG